MRRRQAATPPTAFAALLTFFAALLTLSASSVSAGSEKVGTVDFPTSTSSPEAQSHFLRGVAALHSFGWKQAIAEFEAAQSIEPGFAMPYWGQSLCYNHPLFSDLDPTEPRKALAKLGADPAERSAKAPTEREKGFLAAVEALWGEGDSSARKIAYVEAMERLHQRYPDDDEIAAFFALALLSAAEALGNDDLRHNVRAGSIALDIFARRPDHPGAAHYVIHAFDDPVHAPLALDAARRYAEIAPAVSHARHMPSHIFIQRGMWREVSASNVSAFAAARDLWEPGDSVADMVHSLDWGQYGDLQRGDLEQARHWREELEKIATESKGDQRAASTLPLLDARQLVETEAWKIDSLEDDTPTPQIFVTGLSAAKLGEMAVARRAASLLKARAKQPSDRYDGGGETASIMGLEIEALVQLAKGRRDAALAALDEGRKIEESKGPPAGPASPVKPIHELYGEVLLELGRPERAAQLFQASLDRTPNRPLSLRGLARAQDLLGQIDRSRETWSRLLEIRENRPTAIGVEEAKRALSAAGVPSAAASPPAGRDADPRPRGDHGHDHGDH
jgi:tetratricopeptide (TPR) repeat protein